MYSQSNHYPIGKKMRNFFKGNLFVLDFQSKNPKEKSRWFVKLESKLSKEIPPDSQSISIKYHINITLYLNIRTSLGFEVIQKEKSFNRGGFNFRSLRGFLL